uniref:Uncharacterized protein n=1 Tax=Anguilla anguilla TaxID=7936 RepID=A0A0E9WBY8_ANGAN
MQRSLVSPTFHYISTRQSSKLQKIQLYGILKDFNRFFCCQQDYNSMRRGSIIG